MISKNKLVKLLNLEYNKIFNNENFNIFKYKDNIIYYKNDIFATIDFIKLKEMEVKNNLRLYTNYKVSNYMIYNCLINFLWINRVAINKEIKLV